MNHIKFNSFAPVKNIFEDLFEDLFNGEIDMKEKEWVRFSKPLVNVLEEKDAFRIEVAIPGVKKEDVMINLEKEQLIIKADQKSENVESDKNYTKKEFFFGNFTKTFHVPETVDREEINASFKHGVLYIEMKKKDEAVDKGPQHIEIK